MKYEDLTKYLELEELPVWWPTLILGMIALITDRIVRHCYCQSDLPFRLHSVQGTHEPNPTPV
jgi:hypothetical protein